MSQNEVPEDQGETYFRLLTVLFVACHLFFQICPFLTCLCLVKVFAGESDAKLFLSRHLLANRFDFEMFVPGNLERECREEICNYEEAREVFENIPQTVKC